MRIVEASAPARVALAGNPSDGYGGRTLSLAIENFRARVEVSESERLEIVPAVQDQVRFASVAELADDVRANGYYGGLRLLKATVKRLAEHCYQRGFDIGEKAFSIRYETDIPRGVGLGGSSAIVTAAVRALVEFHELVLDRSELPSLVMSVETDELGIPAGPQDRVAQVYEGLTYMDFDPALGEHEDERYEQLDPGLLPPLFVAYVEAAAEPSAFFHGDLRTRFEAGDRAVVAAMSRLAALTSGAREALVAGDHARFGRYMLGSFEVRRSLSTLEARHVRMIDLACECGAAANYAGSGGAIVGAYEDDAQLEELTDAFAVEGFALESCRIAVPVAA